MKQLLTPIDTLIHSFARSVLHAMCLVAVALHLHVRIEGAEHLPRTGPVLIAAHHFHHLYDGCIFISRLPRRVHIFVALDWVQTRRTRRLMETICSLAIWPITLREERLVEDTTTRHTQHHSAYARSEIKRYFLRAATQSVRLLRRNKVLVIFPEAYPNIDPAFTPKTAQTPFLPFKPGFIRLVEMAERDKKTRVAIIPAGFTYQAEQKKWRVTLRLGASIYRQNCPNNEELLHTIETQMQALSRPCPNERV